MAEKPQIPSGLIKEYNQIVRGFKDAWGVLRALSLIRPDGDGNLSKAKQLIRGLQKNVVDIEKALRGGIAKGVPERLKSLQIELRVFRELLAGVESGLRPPEIRQFFQKTHDTRDEEIVELLKFFYQKPSLALSDVDKVDLLVTEVCSTRTVYKRVLKPEFEIEKIINGIFDKEIPVNEYEDAILSEFETAAGRIANAVDVDEIIKNEVIATMRSFKKEIIEHFMNPRILIAALHYNVELNNKLVDIFEQEEGEILKAAELAASIKSSLMNLSAGQQKTADGLVSKVREIQQGYNRKREHEDYDIKLIVLAAKQRLAIEESMKALREIEAVEPAPIDEGFKRKSTQAYINEIFRGLLRLDSAEIESVKIQDLNIDLKQMDPWEKSLFLMDIQSLGDEQRTYEALREAIVVRSKITEEYKLAKRDLDRIAVESVLKENIEVAENLDKELQGFLDTYNKRSRNFSAIDLMKVKSALSKSLNRLKSIARMEGYKSDIR